MSHQSRPAALVRPLSAELSLRQSILVLKLEQWARTYFDTSKHRPKIIQLAVMMNIRSLLFGTYFAQKIRKPRSEGMKQSPQWQWHLDEVLVKIRGQTHYLWREVDREGEVPESFVTKTRDKASALKFMRKAMRRYGNPKVAVTDKCPSYRAAMKVIGSGRRQEIGRHLNNRAENSHLPFRRRERIMSRFRCMRSLQKFVSIHSSVYNHFTFERCINTRIRFNQKRDAALRE